jgi:hypothetical protein
MTAKPNIEDGSSVVPYSLSTVQSLRAHWHISPSYGVAPDVSMAFIPLLGDPLWTGKLTPMPF